MPHEIRVPRLGWSMEEGTFVNWRKQPGEHVEAGEVLFELEGEKALQDIEAVDSGILNLHEGSPTPGSVVPVGHLLGYLLLPGESPLHVTVSVEVPPELAAAPAEPIASPRARRIAAERGVDWTGLKGTGQGGRIREADVRAVARTEVAPTQGFVRISPRRKAIGDRLRQSRDRTIPVTLNVTADATNLVGLRNQFKAMGAAVVPSITDMMACLVAQVFKTHPHMAARWDEGHNALCQADQAGIHIGIAVDTPEGLLVPVVRDVARMGLIEVAEASRELIEKARAGRLAGEAMQGGVFTITNLGAFGIETFTPIINDPEIAILGLGAIRRESILRPDGRAESYERLPLSLTFDHAAVDGAPAAAFLKGVSQAIENAAAGLLVHETLRRS